jgi:LSD1 subclass zinc finger protein
MAMWEIYYEVSDATSGLKYVVLWYRVDGGAWCSSGMTHEYNGELSANGIFTFEGTYDGIYDFYTVATDLAGNVESTPDFEGNGDEDENGDDEPTEPIEPIITSSQIENTNPYATSQPKNIFIEDDYEKHLLVYQDNPAGANSIKCAYCNDEDLGGWSIVELMASTRRGEFCATLIENELHIFYQENGAEQGAIYDQIYVIQRDKNNNIIDFQFNSRTKLADAGSGWDIELIHTHNDDIAFFWSCPNQEQCKVYNVMYHDGTYTEPIVIYDVAKNNDLPNYVACAQNSINKDLYVFRQKDGENYLSLIKAKWDGSKWEWQEPIERFIYGKEYDPTDGLQRKLITGDQTRPTAIADKINGKILLPIQSGIGWEKAEGEGIKTHMRVLSVDENDNWVSLDSAGLNGCSKSPARSQKTLLIFPDEKYYLLYAKDWDIRGRSKNLRMAFYDGESWGEDILMEENGRLPTAVNNLFAYNRNKDDIYEIVVKSTVCD